ncbi:MAG: glucodextranase DOMON-like domain-containing protein [Acidobacteriota bacterium]
MSPHNRRRIASLRFPITAGLTCFAILLAALLVRGVEARKHLLFAITDPFGDDRGDGSLAYPLRSDLEPGDLDLLRLEARRGDGGTIFRAIFARDIRSPANEAINGLGTQLRDVARQGFYTFNLDLYIDTDRQPGSGQVAMLPGRKAEIAPPHAWEKMVAVTPRPETLRASIHRLRVREWAEQESRKRPVSRAEKRRRKAQIAEELLPWVYFPNRIRVLGRTLEFFVPEAFLGGEAQPTWAYVAAVTGARLEQRFDVPLLGRYPQDSSDGMILPVIPGRDENAFGGGRDNDPLQPPVVDLLRPQMLEPNQSEILRNYDSYQERPAQIPGVVPAEVPAAK